MIQEFKHNSPRPDKGKPLLLMHVRLVKQRRLAQASCTVQQSLIWTIICLHSLNCRNVKPKSPAVSSSQGHMGAYDYALHTQEVSTFFAHKSMIVVISGDETYLHAAYAFQHHTGHHGDVHAARPDLLPKQGCVHVASSTAFFVQGVSCHISAVI